MIKAHFSYAKRLFKHKIGVLIGCRIVGVSFLRGLTHDLSKFMPIEWTPYVNQFYNKDGTKKNIRNANRTCNHNEQPIEFQNAWLHHQKNNHHWQSWVSLGDYGQLNPIEIPEKYVKEMIADWIGAGWSYSNNLNPFEWYKNNKEKMILHKNTAKTIEILLKNI